MAPLALAMLVFPALAQASDGPPLLRHEFVPQTLLLSHSQQLGGLIEGSGRMPRAIERDGERLPAPSWVADGEGGLLRPTAMRPDRETSQDRSLTYHASFNPSVAPFRRNVAFDYVGADYELSIAEGQRVEIELSPREVVPGRELFFGDLVLDAVVRRPMPIPSVAADMRILAVESEPEADLSFFKDGADNYYVRIERAPVGGRRELKLTMLVDADSRYFSAPVPGNVALSVGDGHPATLLPSAARAEGEAVLNALGVNPAEPFDRGIDRMVEYFRGFRAGPPSRLSNDIYRDLALGSVGVCRHRAFAFVITARAAGVPTRYVQNEAHAFAEILAPDGAWRRIDLGGEAPSLELKGGETRRLHQPPADPYPKPASYLESYSSQLIRGALAGSGGPNVAEGPTSMIPARVPLPAEPGSEPVQGAEELADGPQRPVLCALDSGPRTVEAFRGETLPFEVAGRLTDATDAAPIPGVDVQIYMVSAARPGKGIPAGRPVKTAADGRFSVKIRLPQRMPLGRYRVVAASAAHGEWGPGRSD